MVKFMCNNSPRAARAARAALSRTLVAIHPVDFPGRDLDASISIWYGKIGYQDLVGHHTFGEDVVTLGHD